MPTGMAKRDGFSMREVLGLAADNKYMYVLARVRVPTLRSADSVALFRGVKTVNTWGSRSSGKILRFPARLTATSSLPQVGWAHVFTGALMMLALQIH